MDAFEKITFTNNIDSEKSIVHSVDTPDFRTRIRDVLNSRTLARVAFRYKTLHGYNVRAVHFQVRLTL